MLIKKYGNRRLYDTSESRYITLEELAEKIKNGPANDVIRVVDAKTNEDLTQSTLTQIILESRGAGKLLSVPLLIQLVRLGDDALADFFGRYVVWALEVYLQTRQGALGLASLNPFAAAIGNPLARMMGGLGWGGEPAAPQVPVPPPAPPPAPSNTASDVAQLRRELEELKRGMQKPARGRRKS